MSAVACHLSNAFKFFTIMYYLFYMCDYFVHMPRAHRVKKGLHIAWIWNGEWL